MNQGVRYTLEVSPVTGISNAVRGVVDSRFNTIDATNREIMQGIESHHEETKYVYKKHNSQAQQLARLNERLEEKEDEICRLNKTIHGLQEEALADSTGMFEEIKDDIKDMKKLMRQMARKLDQRTNG